MDERTVDHILNILRRGTIEWHVRDECLRRCRKQFKVGTYKNGKDKLLFKYYCEKCSAWFRKEDMEVDHIVEIGTFTGDWNIHIPKVYCSIENLMPLCKWCHLKKTVSFNAEQRFQRKHERDEDLL